MVGDAIDALRLVSCGNSFNGDGRRVLSFEEVLRFEEARVSKSTVWRFRSIGEWIYISTIWGLPTMVNDTTVAVSSWDFLLAGLEPGVPSPLSLESSMSISNNESS